MPQLTQDQRDAIQLHTLGLAIVSTALLVNSNSAKLPKHIATSLESSILDATDLVAECNKTLSGE